MRLTGICAFLGVFAFFLCRFLSKFALNFFTNSCIIKG